MQKIFDIGRRLLVAFDGHCGFCNGSIRWLLRRDRNDRLRFVPLDSDKIAGMLARHSLRVLDQASGSILVVRDAGLATENVLMRSDAVLTLLRELPQPWRALGVVFQAIPRPLRDLAYRLVARWRYRIWGRLESCPMPTDEERARFL